MEFDVYQPIGATVCILAGPVAQAGVQPGNAQSGGLTTARLHNDSANTIFVAYANSAAGAQSLCVIPTPNVPQQCWGVLPRSVEMFKVPAGSYWSAICPAGNSNIFITHGPGA